MAAELNQSSLNRAGGFAVQLDQPNLLFDSIDSFLLSQASAETRRHGLERILSALTCFDRSFRYEKKNKPILRHSGATVGETSQLKLGSSSGKLFIALTVSEFKTCRRWAADTLGEPLEELSPQKPLWWHIFSVCRLRQTRSHWSCGGGTKRFILTRYHASTSMNVASGSVTARRPPR